MSDTTHDALAHLRRLRAGKRRADRRNAMYTAYCVLLLTAIWGVPYLAALGRAADRGDWHGQTADRALDFLPPIAPALFALVPLAAALRARWRGPVLLDAPTVAWLLPHPVPRGPLLLPRFHRSAALAALAGTAAGAVAGLLVHALGAGTWWTAVLAGAGGGSAAGCLGTAAGVLVQRHGTLRIALTAPLPIAALAAVPLLAAAGRAPGWAGAAAAALTAAGTAALLPVARGVVPAIPARVLREQAAVALRLTAALYAWDPRQARATVRAATGRRPRVAVRLPLPRHRPLLVPWRDATGLLRSRGRLAWATFWWALALLCVWTGHRYAVLAALPAGYLAAAQLVEPARLERDDTRRAAQLPWPAGTLALWHGLLPAVLLLATGVVPVALWRDSAPLLLLASVPALVGAALVSAYRGVMPGHLLLGTESPLGGTGPVQALLWHVRGPLVVLTVLGVAQVQAANDRWGSVTWVWVLAAGLCAAAWARRVAGPAILRGGG
ncbi:hypothetical protein [Streptomyces litchfieldiae]|uniref:ABC transporter permease n=1 Tax=Streptomyces litchfieldiae TaxID=3075543 RepID=A0ABU2MZU8_9ACTN|nr:hypothetical protein [Streptomyces sp. DSM 44938]MDT0347050.1 hypothetical protein [Streptomyces sp. DSM 44938]